MKPFPSQIDGAKFLAPRRFAILADAPRVGKTGASIIGGDLALARTVLVVTTASGRGVWRKGFADWSASDRQVQILTPKDRLAPETDIAIVGWPSASDGALRGQLLARSWDLVILDETHYAKNFEAKRTQAVFGLFDDALNTRAALAARGDRVWCLTGTPMPNSPYDLFPMLAFGAPERLEADDERDWPDVSTPERFKRRYCKIRPKKIGHGPYARYIDVIVDGQNTEELRARIDGLFLRRTQQDVGIRPPVYETFPLIVSERDRKAVEQDAAAKEVLAAIDRASTKDLDMHLGPLRRLTGAMKARAVAAAVKEEFENGLDRIVLAYWHKDVAEILIEKLAPFGVVQIDGSTPPTMRDKNVAAFQAPDGPRVFLGQIQAASEAIDLSAASELIFVEMSFVPKDGSQMALRITNHTQHRQARVRVAAIAGSIDDATQASLLRKVRTINEVIA